MGAASTTELAVAAALMSKVDTESEWMLAMACRDLSR